MATVRLVQAHQVAIVAVVVALAVSAMGATMYWWQLEQQEEEASRILGNAFAAMRSDQPGSTGNSEEAAKFFREIVKQFPNSRSAEESLVALGNLQYGAGKTDDALATFSQYLTTFKRGRFTLEAGLGKAYSQEAKGDFQGAAQTLSQVLDKNKGDPLAGESYMSLARLYEEMKKPDDAMRVYGDVVEKYAQTRWAQRAMQRMSALKSK